MNRKKLFTAVQYLFFLGLGIGLVWWQFHSMQPDEKSNFAKSLREANYWFVIPVICMAMLSYLARSQRWIIMMEPLGYAPKSSNTFCSTMIGYMVNMFIPRLGEVVKCSVLSRYEKIPVDKLIGTVVVERMFDVVCYIIFIGITLATQFKVVKKFMHKNIENTTNAGFNWIQLIVIIAILCSVILLFRWMFKRFRENKVVRKIHHVVYNLKVGILSIKNMKRPRAFLGYTVFMWSMYLLEIYIGFYAMKATTGLGLGSACASLTLATLAMIILPGGFGAFPLFITKVLLIYHIKAIDGNAFGWLMWGVSTCINLIIGLLCLLIIIYINKNYHPIETHISDPEEDF